MKKCILFYHFLIGALILDCSAQEKKEVIAVQAMFHEESIIDSLWQKALSYENVISARTNGARPHMTIASFILSKQEITELSTAFLSMNNKFISHRFEVQLSIENDTQAYYLVPVAADSLLIDIHDSLYLQADQGFERQRKIDEPGSWWPHISMFRIKGASASIPDELIEELKALKYVTLKGFSLVSFGPIRYFEEIETLSIDQ